MSKPSFHSISTIAAGLLLWGAAAVLSPGQAAAGSVFMKNGYIIQGPIVERSEESVVMGWPNGKVTIHRRFVENITYEAAEEKRLQEDEAYRAQEKSQAQDDLSLLATSNESEDLPQDLDLLMRRYEENAKRRGSAPAGADSPGASGIGGTVRRIEPPADLLGDRIQDRNVAISFKPPRNWAQKSKPDFFEVSAKTTTNGFRPSINVVCFPRGILKSEDYVHLLKEEDARTLDGYELLSEGPRMVGKDKGYELVGRGSYQEREAIIRQVIVSRNDRVWLITAFTQDQSAEGAFSMIEESLNTFELGAVAQAR